MITRLLALDPYALFLAYVAIVGLLLTLGAIAQARPARRTR